MNCFKEIRKGLKRMHPFYYVAANADIKSSRRILYAMEDCIYLDNKTVGQYRADPPKSMEDSLKEQNEEIDVVITTLKLNDKEKEKKEIEEYFTSKGIMYSIQDYVNSVDVEVSPLMYGGIRKRYNLKHYKSQYLLRFVYNILTLSVIAPINTFLKWVLWPRVGMYSQHKKVSKYLRDHSKKSFSHIDLASAFWGSPISQKKFERDIKRMEIILMELASQKVAVAKMCDGKYSYNSEGQLDFKGRVTPSFSLLVALVAFFSTLTYYSLYFLANRESILQSITKILGH
jgi:hypothetical protein